jgi:hypothetical protein
MLTYICGIDFKNNIHHFGPSFVHLQNVLHANKFSVHDSRMRRNTDAIFVTNTKNSLPNHFVTDLNKNSRRHCEHRPQLTWCKNQYKLVNTAVRSKVDITENRLNGMYLAKYDNYSNQWQNRSVSKKN